MQTARTQFTNWVREQPADRPYNYSDTRGCAVFLFLKENGYPVSQAGGFGIWFDTLGQQHSLNLTAGILCSRPHTFGALADRLSA